MLVMVPAKSLQSHNGTDNLCVCKRVLTVLFLSGAAAGFATLHPPVGQVQLLLWDPDLHAAGENSTAAAGLDQSVAVA